ncbi:MAG: formimidoylglutamate deiminase [Bauldia sp.]|uniref:formimidoylglutamate deiminase n=1 Tax=Bauldia sp. TaxID=2575872 RepID=UPI001DF0C0BC|nr:formimidoylglutamate deiminase [Bauldia sp.]MCB1497017.1 formimidoylglutamate deiminase [Bauldia sp.]
MTVIHFGRALLPDGWSSDVRVAIDADGRIAGVERGAKAEADDERAAIGIPGVPNVHSHTFQRGMAGLAETRGPITDTFWTWRETMYRFAGAITPEDAEAIAAMAFVEMLERGFTTVGEFHYLHHDRDGHEYSDIAEMAVRMASAAASTGIGMVLLPVFYAHSDFGGAPPEDHQKRFICDLDAFARLVEGARRATSPLPGGRTGIAPHSLRAVTPDELDALLPLAGDGPVHIHVAEQTREVEDCVAWCGTRPVAWLIDNQPLDQRWCAIHATHMTTPETSGLARSGATAGLCPVTEASLGDGFFPAVAWREAGGHLGIGTDSNVLIGLADELRQLECNQRLVTRSRNVLAETGRSTGRSLFDAALAGGSAALGLGEAGLAEGSITGVVSLEVEPSLLDSLEADMLLDIWIFAGRARVDTVWRNGVRQVERGRHRHRATVERAFQTTMMRILSA